MKPNPNRRLASAFPGLRVSKNQCRFREVHYTSEGSRNRSRGTFPTSPSRAPVFPLSFRKNEVPTVRPLTARVARFDSTYGRAHMMR